MGRTRTVTGSTSFKRKRTSTSFNGMITTSIQELKEKSGSAKTDILKYIFANWWNVGSNVEKTLETELRKGVKDGTLIQSTKGKSRVRLFRLKQPEENLEKRPVDVVKKNEKEKTKKTANVADDRESSKPDTMTRAKLPVKVKEAKEKKKAAALAKRATAKKAKAGRKKGKKRKASSTNSPGSSTARSNRGIDARIFAAFEEIWRTQL